MDTSKKIKIPEQTKAELKDKAQALGVHYESDAMSEVMYLANTAASSKITVLITGETGVGKGQILNIIHNWSDRADKEFRQVNCGAITSSDLLQSELFGHEDGAFTGAKGQHRGFF
jgi:transcriptional regulator with GAF, ATPase, and Fis domain